MESEGLVVNLSESAVVRVLTSKTKNAYIRFERGDRIRIIIFAEVWRQLKQKLPELANDILDFDLDSEYKEILLSTRKVKGGVYGVNFEMHPLDEPAKAQPYLSKFYKIYDIPEIYI